MDDLKDKIMQFVLHWSKMLKVHLECMKYVLGLGEKNLQVIRTRFIQGMGSESKRRAPYGLRRKS